MSLRRHICLCSTGVVLPGPVWVGGGGYYSGPAGPARPPHPTPPHPTHPPGPCGDAELGRLAGGGTHWEGAEGTGEGLEAYFGQRDTTALWSGRHCAGI